LWASDFFTAIIANADNTLPPTQGTQIVPKYTAQIPVADESDQKRDRAIVEALKQVLMLIFNSSKRMQTRGDSAAQIVKRLDAAKELLRKTDYSKYDYVFTNGTLEEDVEKLAVIITKHSKKIAELKSYTQATVHSIKSFPHSVLPILQHEHAKIFSQTSGVDITYIQHKNKLAVAPLLGF
jgi:hypothetical protein